MADWRLLFSAVLTILSPIRGQENGVGNCHVPSSENTTLYDFQLKNVHMNETINFSDYRGKVVMLVNVATYWGHTYQYHGMNALQSNNKDFQMIGVPCNQFHYVSLIIIYSHFQMSFNMKLLINSYYCEQFAILFSFQLKIKLLKEI